MSAEPPPAEPSVAPAGPRGRVLRAGLGLLVSALAAWLLLERVDVGEVAEVLSRVRWSWAAAALAAKLVAVVLKDRRWRRVLAAMAPGPYAGTFRALCAGYLGNLLLPFKLGEVLRVALLGRANPGLRFGDALATVAAERVLDAAVLAVLAAAALPLADAPPWLEAATGGVVLALAPVLALGTSARAQDACGRALPGGRVGGAARRVVEALSAGSRVLRRPRDLGPTLAWTAAAWVAEGVGLWLATVALGHSVGPLGALVASLFMALGQMIPSAPLQLGTHQALAVLVLGPLGVPPAEAVAVSLLLQAINLVLFGVLGSEALLGAWRGDRAPEAR